METTKTNEALLEGAKVAEKWISDTNAAMMEIYNKQLNLTSGYYTNFLTSFLNSGKSLSENKNFSNSFFSNDLSKWFTIPLNGVGNLFSNPFTSSFENSLKQFSEFNRNLMATVNNQIKNSEADWSIINKEYVETLGKRLEASQKILNSISQVLNKEIDFSIENNKNMIEEINEQFNSVIKQNQKFLSETLKTVQTNFDGEDKKQKEATTSDSKKKLTVPVVA